MDPLPVVRNILVDRLTVKPEEINIGSSLREDLGADSLDLIQIAMDIEDEFGVYINDGDAVDLETVNDILVKIGKR